MVRPIGVVLLAFAPAVLAGAVSAASVRHFDIPAKAVDEALIDFAIQADISIGGDVRCSGRSRPVVGDFSNEAALTRLLGGVACRFVVVAPGTVRIFEDSHQPERPVPSLAGRAPVSRTVVEEQPAPATVPEVIVTATRRPAVAARLADSISVVGVDAMKAAGATDASDIALQLAGVTTTNLGPGRDKILLRGLSDGTFTGRTESTVGIYLDDTRITFNAPDPDLRLADVQSVEVLRGPQGFLYGGGSISGVYRIVSQKPQINQGSESLLVGGALTDAGAPSGEMEGVVNLPLARDVAALRAVVYGEDDGGYIDNVALRKSNIDGTARAGGRAALRVLAGPAWTVTLGGAYQRIDTNDTQYVTPGLGRLHVANQIVESSDNIFAEGNLTLEHSASWGDFTSTTAVTQHNLFSQTDASTALPLFGAGAARVGAYDEPTRIMMVTEDAALTSPNTGRFQWLEGVFGSASVERTNPDVGAKASGSAPAQLLYLEDRTDRLYEMAAYGQLSYALTLRTTLEAGLRISTTMVSVDSRVEAPQVQRVRLFSDSEWSGGVSPKLALKFQMNDDVLLYALASEGHRAGGFNTGGPIGTTFNADGPGPQRRFAADQLWNLETGAKAGLFDNRLRLSSTLFYDIWNNIQTDQFLNSGLSYTANAGNGRNFGAEVEMTYQVNQRLSLRANALANAPELLKGSPGFSNAGGVGLPGVPDYSAGVEAAWHVWPLSNGLSVTLSAQSLYIGRSHLTFDPRTSPRMGGYTLDRLSAQLKGARWALTAFVINPTNASGDTFSYGNPFNFRQIAEVTPQRPLTVRVTLGVDF